MHFWDAIINAITPYIPLLATTLIVCLVLWGAHLTVIKRYQELGNERLLPRQLFMLALTFIGVIAITLALPVSESSRNQIIALIGLIISGIFAFSSSTIFSNIMAGTMLRVTKPFRTGDFIEVGDFFGRVVERGLLDTEIQTENRELVALPNTFLISVPVSVTRSSGCIVSSTLSLGYDVHHSQAEALLIESAKETGLEEPFVQILELGNFSITYKVSGVLVDVKSLLTARSNLRRSVLDVLHGSGVEIMSPTFVAQRKMADGHQAIPVREQKETAKEGTVAEDVVFDKAEKAASFEESKIALQNKLQQCLVQLENATGEEKDQLQLSIEKYQKQIKSLDNAQVKTLADDAP